MLFMYSPVVLDVNTDVTNGCLWAGEDFLCPSDLSCTLRLYAVKKQVRCINLLRMYYLGCPWSETKLFSHVRANTYTAIERKKKEKNKQKRTRKTESDLSSRRTNHFNF